MKAELQQNYQARAPALPSAALQILSNPTPVSSVTSSERDEAIQRTDEEMHLFQNLNMIILLASNVKMFQSWVF